MRVQIIHHQHYLFHVRIPLLHYRLHFPCVLFVTRYTRMVWHPHCFATSVCSGILTGFPSRFVFLYNKSKIRAPVICRAGCTLLLIIFFNRFSSSAVNCRFSLSSVLPLPWIQIFYTYLFNAINLLGVYCASRVKPQKIADQAIFYSANSESSPDKGEKRDETKRGGRITRITRGSGDKRSQPV
jgi:hypothetical protein